MDEQVWKFSAHSTSVPFSDCLKLDFVWQSILLKHRIHRVDFSWHAKLSPTSPPSSTSLGFSAWPEPSRVAQPLSISARVSSRPIANCKLAARVLPKRRPSANSERDDSPKALGCAQGWGVAWKPPSARRSRMDHPPEGDRLRPRAARERSQKLRTIDHDARPRESLDQSVSHKPIVRCSIINR